MREGCKSADRCADHLAALFAAAGQLLEVNHYIAGSASAVSPAWSGKKMVGEDVVRTKERKQRP
jgi:hypothetical protein